MQKTIHPRSHRLWALVTLTAALCAAVAVTSPAAFAAPSCTTATIGLMYPATGPAASIGKTQANWARQSVADWNKTHELKLRMVEGDTQLPKTSEASKVATQFGSNKDMLAVVGPAGSNEVSATSSILKKAGFAFITPSSTAAFLTDGKLKGYFFRVVPNDNQQSKDVVKVMTNRLGVKSGDTVVVIDDQEDYGKGLSDAVQEQLEALGVKIQRESINPDPAKSPDFSSLAARVPNTAKAVYIPWQLAGSAQAFGQALKEQGKTVTIVGSDGLFDPKVLRINGTWLTFFAQVKNAAVLAAHKKKHGGGEFFGAPAYVAVDIVGRAIERACKDGKVTRDEVRRQVALTNVGSIMGLQIRFTANGDLTVQRYFTYEIVGGNYILRT